MGSVYGVAERAADIIKRRWVIQGAETVAV